MNKSAILMLTILGSFTFLAALPANWTQYYFKFKINDRAELQNLTTVISIDNVRADTVWAYANDDEWAAFQSLGYKGEILPNPGLQIIPEMHSAGQTTRVWDSYPTYEAYVSQMYAFQTNYPALCQIVDAGTTVNGRKILFAKISDNISVPEAEPEVMYTSTIHGDETTGYILMLRMIDYLLSNYATDNRVQTLVNNLEIWINPNANPDGTYYGGNNSVSGARRYNFNGIDLNRSFPDIWGGTTQAHQVENTIMEDLANAHHFVLSANLHGGAEVFNYPWDGSYILHTDNNWYANIGTAYVNAVHAVSSIYMDDLYSGSIPGLTNGAAWYIVYGGRQDWMNYHKQCRENTIEISTTKLLPAAQLPTYWGYNYNAMLGYLENALHGLQGIVTDGNGLPLSATITVVGVDDEHSKATTDPVCGDYIRMLLPGSYTVQVSAAGYPIRTFNNVVVAAGQKTTLNVVLGEASQNIHLSAGWNLISLRVTLADYDVQNVFASLGTNLLQVKDRFSTWSPNVSPWFNTLSSLQASHAYWIKVASPAILNFTGPAMEPSFNPINLDTGWNLVAYYPYSTLAVGTALASITANLQEVRSQTQFYIPGNGGNTLTQMTAGQGYWIKVSQACVLTYPSIR